MSTVHRNLVSDTLLVISRELKPVLSDPFSPVFELVQPLFFLLLFGPLLEAEAGFSWAWFVPGVLVMISLCGTAGADRTSDSSPATSPPATSTGDSSPPSSQPNILSEASGRLLRQSNPPEAAGRVLDCAPHHRGALAAPLPSGHARMMAC